MERARPVPPYLRVVEASAWVKGLKSRAICSGVIPIPSLLTVTRTNSRPPRWMLEATRLTSPWSANLQACDVGAQNT